MSFMTQFASRMLALPPAEYSQLEYQIDLPVPMSDGAILLANRIAPRNGASLPIILIRNPYTARGKKPGLVDMLIAERGYQVVVQNCRGTWGSGGEFRPFEDDREDGLATVRWLAEQPWFSGSVGMFGMSYWGYAQLALGAGAPDYLKALVPQMAASRVYEVFRNRGSLSLDTALTWNYETYVMNTQPTAAEKRRAKRQRDSLLNNGFMHLPLREADRVSMNFTSPFFQGVLRNDQPDDEFWSVKDYSEQVNQIEAPVHFIGGWYDFFLVDELADYQYLWTAGKNPYLTIGPWTHTETGGLKAGFKESFAWYDAHLKGNRAALRTLPVRVLVMGSNRWVDLPSWPPPATASKWYLSAGRRLVPDSPSEKPGFSRYRYDPVDPTPNVGGAVRVNGGPKDNRGLESRPDVLTFTSEPMKRDMTIMGPVSAVLYVRSSRGYTDFHVRLCDVSRYSKKSINICDGIVRLDPSSGQVGPDGILQIKIDLHPTAHCFKVGHRIRLQVSSGAHPRHARNLGTGEPIGAGTAMCAADQEVFHDPSHPSAIMLPIVSV